MMYFSYWLSLPSITQQKSSNACALSGLNPVEPFCAAY